VEVVVTAAADAEVRVFEDYGSLSHAAAELFVELGKTAVASPGRFAVALSGGSTPRQFYSLLGSSPYRDNLDWHRVHIFWADERCVPPDDPESNFKLVYDTLLSTIAIPDSNIHRVKGEEGPEKAARVYEQDIKIYFGSDKPVYDLIILGVGKDGHTASVFPGSIAIHETARIALPVLFSKPGVNRVTLTLPIINLASHVLILASGKAKSDVVQEILEGENLNQYPAGLVHPVKGSITWLIDREAAASLNPATCNPPAPTRGGSTRNCHT
jgi:6-phosphogluconolactonase